MEGYLIYQLISSGWYLSMYSQIPSSESILTTTSPPSTGAVLVCAAIKKDKTLENSVKIKDSD
jgi:hypothetical protein